MSEKYGRAASTNEALQHLATNQGRASPVRSSKFSSSMKQNVRREEHPWRNRRSKAASLSIKNFDYEDLPQVEEKTEGKLSTIISSSENVTDVISGILDGESSEAYSQKLLQLGDCNLALETPLILALMAKSLTHSTLLIARESAELFFCSLSNQSAYQLIYDEGALDGDFQRQIRQIISLLRKFSMVDYHFTEAKDGYEIKVKKSNEEPRFIISRKVAEHPSHALFTRHVGYGSQATISRVQTFSRDAKVLEICLITVRILRRQGIDKSIEDVETTLRKAALCENWSEPEKWREHLKLSCDPVVLDELEKYSGEHLLDKHDIISIMNFIYLLKRKHLLGHSADQKLLKIIGSTFEDYAKWCGNTFPKLFKVVETAIPDYIRRVNLSAQYSNRKEFPIIKTLVDKIDALANYKLKMADRFDLNTDPRKVKDRKKSEELNSKRADFVCLVRFKRDEDLDHGIRERWASLVYKYNRDYINWSEKLNKAELNELYTLSLGYQSDINGMMNFWSNFLNNENLSKDLTQKLFDYLSIYDYNYNLSPGTPSALLTPHHETDNVFLFDKPIPKADQVLNEKDLIVKCIDHLYPEFIPLLTRAFGQFTCNKPILAKKEYFVFDQPKYFRHLLLVNQIQATFVHPNLLQLDSYWLEQRPNEDVTRIVTNTKFCKGGTLEGYITTLNNTKMPHLGHFRSLHLCQQLWNAIRYLQQNSLQHKDIKPSNVFIDKGDVKLGDFGLMNYPSVESGSPSYMPKDIQNFNGQVDLYAFGMILIEVFYQNGSLAVQLVRHTNLCWSKDDELFGLLAEAAGENKFYKQLNVVIQFLCSGGPRKEKFDESPDDEFDPNSFAAAETPSYSEVSELLRWRDRVSVRPSLNLERVSPFFKNDSFIMNYIGELINHIDRQMSSTTQNNEQKEKAVSYIQSIEDVFEKHVVIEGFVSTRRLHDEIMNRLRAPPQRLIGVAREISNAANSDKARVILPGKNNSKYNSIEIVKKWPLIFLLQTCRNMYAHFHQCNEKARAEICGADQSQANRRKQLIKIYRELFPFVGRRFEMLETSMPVLVALMAKTSEHQPLLAALSNTGIVSRMSVVHAPGGNPIYAPDEIQATFLVRLGDYLNILRYNDLDRAMALESQMIDLDANIIHHGWREHLISLYRKYNPQFPENFKIKCKTTKLTDESGSTIEKPNPNSFLCMLDYFRNILVHLPLKDRLGGAKADRRKEVAISTAVERFISTTTTESDAEQMSRGKMVLFFKSAFPGFINIVVEVVRAQPNFAFANNSVFVTSSKIRQID